MTSRKQQLAVCKAELAALQDEMKEAKDERKSAKSQLEKAIQEGKPDSILASFKALLESASANLTSLRIQFTRKEEELLKRETQLNLSPFISDDEIQEISTTSEGSLEQRKVDVLIKNSKKYLFRTDRWGCVTVIKKRRAVTFAHNEHCTLQPGISIKIYSIETNVQYDAKVVKTNAESDWVLLECGVDLCEKEPIWGTVFVGHRYVQLGLSALHQEESPFAISTGVISSERSNALGHILVSFGANPGDSGGACFDESSGCLIGINVGCENIPINMEKDIGAQIYNKISSRYAARAHIIPIFNFHYV